MPMRIPSILFLLLISFADPVSAATPADTSTVAHFFRYQHEGKFEQALELTALIFREKATPALLQQIWQQTEQTFGAYRGILSMTSSVQNSMTSITAVVGYTQAKLTWQVVFDVDGHIQGFFLIKQEPIVTNGEELTIVVPDGHLKGTLQYPEGRADKSLVALIIAGSGPTDRNGNSPLGVWANTYQLLADSLASHGIASFRYDKRGIGGSNNFTKLSDVTFEQFVQDAVACIRHLTVMEGFAKCVVIGHSEGALIGLLATKQADAAAYVSLAGMARPFGDIIKDQLIASLNPDAESIAVFARQLDSLRQNQEVQSPAKEIEFLFAPGTRHFAATLMQYHPVKELRGIRVPTLIVHGTRDLQIPVKDAHALADACPAAHLVIIDDVNHVLKAVPNSEQDNVASYGDPSLPLSSTLVSTVVSFIKALLR